MGITRIASIHFDAVKAERNYKGGGFEIPAVAAGAEPFVLEVADAKQIEYGGYSETQDKKRRLKKTFDVFSQDIARDIVAQWTEMGIEMNPACHPGIWVVRDRLPEINADGTQVLDADGKSVWRDATHEEKKAMWAEDLAAAKAADYAYAERVFAQGSLDAENPVLVRKGLIPYKAKLAAARYGWDAAWAKPGSGMKFDTCPDCKKSVPAGAVICYLCKTIIDIQAYAKREALKDAMVRAEVEAQKLREPQKPAEAKSKAA